MRGLLSLLLSVCKKKEGGSAEEQLLPGGLCQQEAVPVTQRVAHSPSELVLLPVITSTDSRRGSEVKIASFRLRRQIVT